MPDTSVLRTLRHRVVAAGPSELDERVTIRYPRDIINDDHMSGASAAFDIGTDALSPHLYWENLI